MEQNYKAILDCMQFVSSEKDCETAIRYTLSKIGLFYQADRVYILDAQRTVVFLQWSAGEANPVKQTVYPASLQERLSKEDLVVLANTQEYAALQEQGIHACIISAYKIENTPAGYIYIENPKGNIKDTYFIKAGTFLVSMILSTIQGEEAQDYHTYHDTLTGLYNRKKYAQYIKNLHSSTISSMGVLTVDINGLRAVNRDFGHPYGDRMILQTANVLRTHFTDAMLFRFGSDEFVVLYKDISFEAFEKEVKLVKNVLATMIYNGICVGYTWSDTDIEIEQMLNHAYERLLIEKQSYYETVEDTKKHSSPVVYKNLKYAIDNGMVQIVLQPKYHVQTGKAYEAEALARIVHPEYGEVQPVNFIPLLEKERLIQHVDYFIFEEACKLLQRWKLENKPLMPISVNFSRITLLDSNLLPQIVEIQQRYNIPPELLEIEITESIGDMELQPIEHIIEKVLAHGFRIALDDFGTKYTNLSLLTTVRFHVLKLDRSMIMDIEENVAKQIVVKSIIDSCRQLHVQFIAEGVETQEQLELLRQLGCEYVQGFYFSRPLPVAEFEQICKKGC